MSFEGRKESNKVVKQDSPNSTTKERSFIKGEEIFVLVNDQFVFGEVKEVDTSTERCLVTFPNGENLWTLFKNIKATESISQSPLKCCVVCKSTQGKKYNIVLTCNTCSRGYHQKCHKPVIKTATEDKWNCSVCSKERNCQLSANIVTQKTVSSTSKDSSLPGSSEDLPYYNSNGVSHPDLPPTPPSSVSAPETPQPIAGGGSSGSGEPSASPCEDGSSCVDFDDNSTTGSDPPTLINLDEIFGHLEEATPTTTGADLRGITFPLPLNVVITATGPLVRTKKRKLSSADFVVVDGQIKYKRRRPRKRIVASSSSACLSSPSGAAAAAAAAVAAATNKNNQKGVFSSYSGTTVAAVATATTANNSSCRTASAGAGAAASCRTAADYCETASAAADASSRMTDSCIEATATQMNKYTDTDLKNRVRKYYEDENRRLVDHQVDRIALGDEYRICGKRKTFDSRVQYLVEWLKCNRFDI